MTYSPDLSHAVNTVYPAMVNLSLGVSPKDADEEGYVTRAATMVRACVLATGIVGGPVGVCDGRRIIESYRDGFNAAEREELAMARGVLLKEGIDADHVRLFCNLNFAAAYLGFGGNVKTRKPLHEEIQALAKGAILPKEPEK